MLRQEDLRAGMKIRLIGFAGPWKNAIVEILEDYEYVSFTGEDGEEIEEPWPIRYTHNICEPHKIIRRYKGRNDYINLNNINDKIPFILHVQKTNKPEWF